MYENVRMVFLYSTIFISIGPSPRHSQMTPLAGEITREVLAAVMSAAWAVPDTSTYYSAAAGPGEDYRWSVGNTPFGPLSHR